MLARGKGFFCLTSKASARGGGQVTDPPLGARATKGPLVPSYIDFVLPLAKGQNCPMFHARKKNMHQPRLASCELGAWSITIHDISFGHSEIRNLDGISLNPIGAALLEYSVGYPAGIHLSRWNIVHFLLVLLESCCRLLK